jgi:molybdopterin-containing oxidoreductase family iron-sulfur binding subunit
MSDRSVTPTDAKPWQSIEQLAGTLPPAGEFAAGITEAPHFSSNVSRRGFMALLSASMALTAAACRRPIQKLVPTVKSLQVATPGLPMDYTSVWTNGNVAYGALVRTREGRPIKVRGNDQHTVNRGKASAAMQASLLSLYDPDRIRRTRVNSGQASLENAVAKIADAVSEASAAGKKAVVLTDVHASPSWAALMTEITAAAPAVTFVTVPAVVEDASAMATRALLGVDGELVPDLSKAAVIVSIEADFLGTDPLALYHTGRFAQRRRPGFSDAPMSALHVAESQYTLTGANADARHILHPAQFEQVLAIIEKTIGGSNVGSDIAPSATGSVVSIGEKLASALRSAPAGQAVVLVGRHCSPRAHAIALAVNNTLGAMGTGSILDPAHVLPNSGVKQPAIDALVDDMASGRVHVVIAANVNPEYSGSREFKSALAKVPVRVALNLYEDETAGICSISVPTAHWLETWGDAVAFDGTLSVRQPMIAPLNEGIPGVEDTLIAVTKKLNAAFLGETADYYTYVKNRWTALLGASGNAEAAWTKALQDGVVPQSPTPNTVVLNVASASALPTSGLTQGKVVVALPALSVGSGADANNGWLQELADPVTKITWDNVALMSPATAVALGLAPSKEAKDVVKANESVVTLTTAGGSIDVPVWVQVGMADDVIATQLGYGRTKAGSVGTAVGSNAYALAERGGVTSYRMLSGVRPTGKKHRVATTQSHHTLDDGNGERSSIARTVSTADLASGRLPDLNPHYIDQGEDKNGNYKVPLSITPDYKYKGHKWGMVIDMSSCTGCSSCVIACQSENNIPVVGKDQVLRGREMHWIRIDRYYRGDMDNPMTVVEPMLCQHCDNAPCENVCPVAATTHSPEGLNEMTYNRCVGTRYCLNNCPYKVRRFNFLNYHDGKEKSPLDLVFNPDVTTRMRGVMEKCTFCVQRINDAKYHAKDAGRARVLDGEVVTACQEACPAGAIIFGDTNDPNSAVSKARIHERRFHVLAELNVRPSVTYLAKVYNTDKKMLPESGGH